ncbi:MAG: GGDEF domain-containing protein [Actinobacteria bacterium]|nr:GGDEF domain-containing protein [Actinomycetota bacterium]
MYERPGSRTARLAVAPQTDELTGLLNQGAWHRHLQHELLRARRSHAPVTIVLVDLDEFEQLNDTRGRQAGDRLLKELAAAWRRAVRETDHVGRIGGDEFGLLLPGCDLDDAYVLMGRLRAVVPAGMTCSMGVATWDLAEGPERLLLRADEALYAAKRRGRDRIAC